MFFTFFSILFLPNVSERELSLSNLLRRPTQLYLGEGSQKKGITIIQVYNIHIHIQKLAAMCSVATKLRRLALCAFI